MGLRPELNGLRMQLPGDATIYLIDRGVKRPIPNVPTYDNLFRGGDGVVPDPHLNEIDTGAPLTDGAVLMQGFGQTAIYLVDEGKKRHIASLQTMDRYDFASDKIQHVAPVIVAAIPDGQEISWP